MMACFVTACRALVLLAATVACSRFSAAEDAVQATERRERLEQRLAKGFRADPPESDRLVPLDWRRTYADLCEFWQLSSQCWPSGPADMRAKLAYQRFKLWAEACARRMPEEAVAERQELGRLHRAVELYLRAGDSEAFWHELLDALVKATEAGGDHGVVALGALPKLPTMELRARKHALEAIACAKSGDRERAIELFAEFGKRFPDDPFAQPATYCAALGRVTQQKYRQAQTLFQAAAKFGADKERSGKAEGHAKTIQQVLDARRHVSVLRLF